MKVNTSLIQIKNELQLYVTQQLNICAMIEINNLL